jgi:hypothetical protein
MLGRGREELFEGDVGGFASLLQSCFQHGRAVYQARGGRRGVNCASIAGSKVADAASLKDELFSRYK